MNVFRDDDTFQLEKRNSILVPFFYQRYFFERYVLLDGQMDYQARSIDTLIYTGLNAVTHVEEKIVRKKHAAFALETKSCTVAGYEKPGWMFHGEADRLLYCFTITTGLDCWWINFPALQNWFWPRESDFPAFHMSEANRSAGRVVNIAAINPAILIGNFHIEGERR